MDLSLTPDEKNLYGQIREMVRRARELYAKDKIDEAWKVEEPAIPLAVELHKKLAQRGNAPVFKSGLVENRRSPVGTDEFYRHHHALQALVAFIELPEIAGDAADLTMNKDFSLKVFSRRSGCDIALTIRRIKSGWRVTLVGPVDCDFGCRPALFHELENESIQYPCNLPDRMEFLWDQAKAGKSPNEIQRAFDELGVWMSDNEKRTPTGGAWEGYT